MRITQDIEANTIIFLLNEKTGTIIGPFTVAKEPEDLVKGAWYSSVDEKQVSENIKVEWESLAKLEDAANKFPFLKDKKNCTLSTLQTQELLAELRKAPSYSGQKSKGLR